MICLIKIFLDILCFWILNCSATMTPTTTTCATTMTPYGLKLPKVLHCCYKMPWNLKHTWYGFNSPAVLSLVRKWIHWKSKRLLGLSAMPGKILYISKSASIHPKLNPSKIESIQNRIHPRLNPSKIAFISFSHHLGHLIPFGLWPNLFWRPDDSFTVLSVFLFCKNHSQSQLNLEMELCQTPVKLGFCQWGS